MFSLKWRIILFIYCGLPAVASAIEQQVKLAAFTSLPNKNISGATMAMLMGKLSFKYSLDDYRKNRDSVEKVYVIDVSFYEGDSAVYANAGYRRHGDSSGVLSLTRELKLASYGVYDYDLPLTFPLASFRLPAGKHAIVASVTIRDKLSGAIVAANLRSKAMDITLLPVQNIQLWVRGFAVDTLDQQGQVWDFSLWKPADFPPDVMWALSYGETILHTSTPLKNAYVYQSEDSEDVIEIAVCKNENMKIKVVDVDELTPNDLIGEVLVETEKYGDVAVKADKVALLAYRLKHF